MITVRRAEEKDAEKTMKLLSEVLELHAKLRPDIFISGRTKYTREQLHDIFRDDENSRGQHVGTILFDHVKKYAREQGCYDVTLNVWEGNNAREFYDKMGMFVKETQMEIIL